MLRLSLSARALGLVMSSFYEGGGRDDLCNVAWKKLREWFMSEDMGMCEENDSVDSYGWLM